ncbi:regulator of chromosome condensation 1/beta-lactamase-inhibitor protein II [Irpex rosettiformis]|uniref:Regulator of chromosome condensation 1/beta-lactamase-inhibitor protein II n=1 Tax=Irpex rosettiformis TaxID=378272 RepID=A0ACB8TW65_9APHY|nr:regulator of chromosome condensation 1/beta-lactamase-inhibitor protein II [Irpex rosettiformis]
MLRVSQTLQRAGPYTTRRLLSQTSNTAGRARWTGRVAEARTRRILWLTTSAVGVGTLWHLSQRPIHNDSQADELARAKPTSVIGGDILNDGSLQTLVWGSNRSHTLSSNKAAPESVRTPAVADWLEGVALRDLVLQENHTACIDARGDVYQWGDGYFGTISSAADASSSGKPALTLRNKNIVSLQATSDRIFALSASGRIYVLSSKRSTQKHEAGAPTPSSDPWWGTGWMWGEDEDIDFAEIHSNEKLGWREKFVSIAAGENHLLALTSKGRTFAHPINLKANTFGQLGLRKFDVPDPSMPIGQPHIHSARVSLQLTPKSIADPYANASPSKRQDSTGASAQAQPEYDDSSIRFSDRLFEIPALKGVNIKAIAAGTNTSFAKTTNGRVLGWGANQFGQIGLGSNVALEAITVPTEVILWRSTPQAVRTTCLDIYAGGDLTFFKVERADGSALPYIDVLACGNGQYGGLGNAQYTNSQGMPVRTKNVSGLLEYSELAHNLQPIYPHDISVSPTGHVLLTLDTLARSGPGGAGRDLLVWGANQEYQLGNGKRGSLAAPQTLHAQDGQRFMLAERKADVKDLRGKLWKKKAKVEQRAVAGWGNSVIYWRICL